jgi:hypothetical protein
MAGLTALRALHFLIGRVLWIGALLGVAAAFFALLNIVSRSEISAPQQGAGAAMACAWAIIPYVLARAWDKLGRPFRS